MSLQQDHYLAARAAEKPVDEACALAGIPASEAVLIEKDIARGAIALPIPAAGLAAHHREVNMTEVAPNEPEIDDAEIAETDHPIPTLAADTLRGDVRDSLLDWLKATPKPWSQMAQAEQHNLADAADRFARTLVKEVCQIVASNERPCIVAQLVEYKEKDGVEAKLKLASKGEVVAALHEACGREVLLVTSGYEEFSGQAADAEIDADQPAFPALGEEYLEAAA